MDLNDFICLGKFYGVCTAFIIVFFFGRFTMRTELRQKVQEKDTKAS